MYDGTIRIENETNITLVQNQIQALVLVAQQGAQKAASALGGMSAAAEKSGVTSEAAMGKTAKTAEAVALSVEKNAAVLQLLADAGQKAKDQVTLLPSVLNLAAAAGIDLDTATKLITKSMEFFSLKAEDAKSFTDQLAQTAQSSKASIAELGEAILAAGEKSKSFKTSTVDLGTALGLMADGGLKGKEAGEALVDVLGKLYSPGEQAAAMLKMLGVETTDADGKLREAGGVLQDLSGALDGLSEDNKAQAMGKIFDTETMGAANTLLGDSSAKWTVLSDSIGQADGMAAAMAKTTSADLNKQLKDLNADLDAVSAKVATAFKDGTQAVTDFGKLMTDAFAGNAAGDALGSIGEGFNSLKEQASFLKPAIEGIPLAFKAYSSIGAITESFNTLRSAMGSANSIMGMAQGVAAGQAAANKLLTASVNEQNVAELAKTLSKKAGMTVEAATTALTTASTAANGADTAAVLLNSGALSAKTVIMGVLTGSITATTAAQWLWNAAMAANPIGLFVAGLAALVAIGAAVFAFFSRDSDEVKKLKEETESLIEANNALTDSMAQSQKSYDDNISSLNATSGATDKMVDKLFALQKEIEEVGDDEEALAKKQGELEVVTKQLNSSIPGLNLEYDRMGNALNMTEDSIRSLATAQKEQMLAQAKQARAMELATELMQMQEQLDASTAKYDELKAAGQENSKEAKKLKEEIDRLTESMATSEEQIESYIEEAAESAAASEEAAKSFEMADENLVGLAEQYGTTAEAIRQSLEESGQSLDEWKTAQDELAAATEERTKAMESAYDSFAGVTCDAFNRIKQEQALEVEEMIATLEHNQDAVGRWSENMAAFTDIAASSSNESLNKLVGYFSDLGPEYADQLGKLVDAGEDKLILLAEAMENGSDEATNAVLVQFGLPEIVNSGADMIDNISDNMDANSAMEDSAVCTIEKTAEAIAQSIQDGDFPSFGKQIVQGMADGVRNNISILSDAIRKMVRDGLAAGRRESDSHSPSRRFAKELGKPLIQGVGVGVEANADIAADAMGDAVDNIVMVASSRLQLLRHLADNPGLFMPLYAAATSLRTVAPATAAAGGYSNQVTNIYNSSMDVDVTAPKAMSEADLTRQLEAAERRSRWLVP